ncbi:MAG TPA: NifB/NifX family molybdenum-iron cluster-binding protein [bacterium]|nr:NifB/NifX family molybdenum-iron cluster-binding protein [bacterium]
MRIGIPIEEYKGLNTDVSAHFGQCRNFLLVDVADNKIKETRIVPNGAAHGGGGCLAVDELLKHDITDVVAGGMGMNAQHKFGRAGVRIFAYQGKVQDAINELLKGSLGGLDACSHHGDGGCH